MTALVRMGLRVASVDIDVHHGDGVQEAFYGTERALTISFHEYGAAFFPMTGSEIETGIGRGTGYNVNIPLRAGTDDDVYVPAFEAIVPPLLGAFKPDVVFAQIGGDLHRDGPARAPQCNGQRLQEGRRGNSGRLSETDCDGRRGI